MAPKKDESHSEHIDQIREIILGPQKKDFEDRFEKLDADLDQLRAEMKAAIERTRDGLAAELRETAQRLEQATHNASAAHQQEAGKLRERTDDIERQASSRLQEFIGESGKQLTALHTDLKQALGVLRGDLHAMREEFSGEMNNRFSALADATVSRSTLGEILFELAMRLKNEQSVDALQKATDRETGPHD